MFTLICQQCWKEFTSKGRDKKYCWRDCYHKSRMKYENKICPICNTEFYPEAPTQKYCSHKCLGLAQRTKPDLKCQTCGKMFYSANNSNKKYCCKECYTKAQTTVKENNCKNCWKLFRWRKNESRFCCKQCQLDYARNMPIDEKMRVLENLKKNKKKISKINRIYKKYLEDLWYKVRFEFQIQDRYYDLKVWNTLIEINPFPYHNSTWAPMEKQWNNPTTPDYHYNKLKLARDNGFRCIMIWDWDNYSKIPYLLEENKQQLYARKCEVKEISREECHDFFESYHLQWDTKIEKNNIYIWLYYENNLVECMSFWKPRYNKNYEREILRLCSHKDYKIIWWANKIFKHFLELTQANSVISYCDMSKFDWWVYEQLGFKLFKWNKPSKHWYNNKEISSRQHITDNLLRQRWYDQIFWENYGKWANNDELMRQRGYVEIYDCGQSTFVWTR